MKFDLPGKTAMVTGGAKRIGGSIALGLAEAGANVVVHYRDSAEEVEAVVREIEGFGVKAWTVQADLTVQDDLNNLMDRAAGLAGRIDILVNNASSFPESTLETVTLDELMESVKLEAWAPLVLGRTFAEKMGSGHIVNILDTRTFGYDWNHAAYHAAKHMSALFTREMAIRFAPGVAVNAVAPGLILPPAGKDQAYLEGLKDRVPLKQVGDPRDVADAVVYLVTSKYVTGQVIFVDGGRHLAESASG